jgi:D-glycero-alpha-D-manno-heptose-7-phosphate kinase
MIIVRAPLRVSFFGGGTDHPSWFRRPEPGAVLSTTIDKYIYIQLRRLPAVFDFNYRVVWRMVEQVATLDEIQHPIVREVLRHYAADADCGYEVVYNADLPARSGLGSSSSFTVAMLHAFLANQSRLVTKSFLAREAIRLEQDILGEPVGCQDQVAAAYGGLSRIDFSAEGGPTVSPVTVSPARKAALEQHLMLFFTHFTRSASDIEARKIESFDSKTAEMRRLHAQVAEGERLLLSETTPIAEFGGLLHEAWEKKRTLAASVSNPDIDQAYAAARAAGAIGGKLLGAGGGGFLLFLVPPARQDGVRQALGGLTHVPISMESAGSSVVLHAPELTSNYLTAARGIA